MSFSDDITNSVTSLNAKMLAAMTQHGEDVDKQIASLNNLIEAKDNSITDMSKALNEANALIAAVSEELHYVPGPNNSLVDWAKKIYTDSIANLVGKPFDYSVRGWACWSSLYGGASWDARAALPQTDHLSVTQKWQKWNKLTGFSAVAEAANAHSKGMWLALHPGAGPEMPPDIQALVPVNQRIPTTIKGVSSWYAPWWVAPLMAMWKDDPDGPIQVMAKLHSNDPQLRMVRAAMPPMAMGEPYMDGSPTSSNKSKWINAYKAAGKADGLTIEEAWESLCNDYYLTLGRFIEQLAGMFPTTVRIAVASGIGMGDVGGNRIKAMIESLKRETRERVCLQHNGLNHIPTQVSNINGKPTLTWAPEDATDQWVLRTAEIAKSCDIVLGYQTVTGAAGGGPGPMGLEGLDKALSVGSELGMSYCEIYGTDFDAIIEGSLDVGSVLDKWDLTK